MSISNRCTRRRNRTRYKIAGAAHEAGKGIIIVINKWDAIKENGALEEYKTRVVNKLAYLTHALILFTSAKQDKE